MNNRIKGLSVQATDYANYQNEMFGVNFNDAYNEKFAELIAADIAELCSDIDGGENMFSRAIRRKYGVK